MSKRKALSKKTRFEVFKRDGFTCQYCGNHPPSVTLHVDHIVAVANGGENDQDNLTTSCDACNLGKGARLLSVIPLPLSVKAAIVAEREEQLRGYTRIMMAKRERIEDDTWTLANVFIAQYLDPEKGIRRDWFQSIKNFVDKLGVADCLDAMELAISKFPSREYQCFRYFCGVCWRKIKEPT